jgi:hypothetical protein
MALYLITANAEKNASRWNLIPMIKRSGTTFMRSRGQVHWHVWQFLHKGVAETLRQRLESSDAKGGSIRLRQSPISAADIVPIAR